MVKRSKRGASRKAVRKQRPAIVWSSFIPVSIISFSILAIVGVISYFQQANTFPILHVTVEGEFIHVDKQALMGKVSPYAKGSFFSVDVASLRTAGRSLPWVKELQVRRIWPDSLHLIVEEQVAVARWQSKWLVNNEGETFLPSASKVPSGLAMLEGPENSNALVVQRYQTMVMVLLEQGLAIKALTMDKRRAWNLTLTNGMKVILGRANSEQRFARFLRVYQSELQQYQTQLSIIDMRYTNGLAVTWKMDTKPNFNGTVS